MVGHWTLSSGDAIAEVQTHIAKIGAFTRELQGNNQGSKQCQNEYSHVKEAVLSLAFKIDKPNYPATFNNRLSIMQKNILVNYYILGLSIAEREQVQFDIGLILRRSTLE